MNQIETVKYENKLFSLDGDIELEPDQLQGSDFDLHALLDDKDTIIAELEAETEQLEYLS